MAYFREIIIMTLVVVGILYGLRARDGGVMRRSPPPKKLVGTINHDSEGAENHLASAKKKAALNSGNKNGRTPVQMGPAAKASRP